MLDERGRLLHAALGFTTLAAAPLHPALALFHRWLDTWTGIGHVIVGMQRQGYEISLGDHGGQWIAVFDGGYEKDPKRYQKQDVGPAPVRTLC